MASIAVNGSRGGSRDRRALVPGAGGNAAMAREIGVVVGLERIDRGRLYQRAVGDPEGHVLESVWTDAAATAGAQDEHP
jgi:hypothetical protein